MGIPTIFIAFVIFIIVFRYKIHKNTEFNKKKQVDFWSKESDSHAVRKKDIDPSDFLKTNPEAIPTFDASFYKSNNMHRLHHSQLQCQGLAKEPLMNLSHMLNSDVRLKYGTAQLPLIETYENNYNSYIQHLSILGNGLLELEYYTEAKRLFEEAISLGSDASHVWINLGTVYHILKDRDALIKLINKATDLDSLMQHKISVHLNELLDQTD